MSNKEKLEEIANEIEFMAFSSIEKAISRIIKNVKERIKSKKTIEDKILYCNHTIKLIKQSKLTHILPKIKTNENTDFLNEIKLKYPNVPKIIVKWLKTEIEYLQSLPQYKTKKVQQNNINDLNIVSIKNEQNKLIPKVSIDEVFNHFEILTKTTNKNNDFYLTNEQLLIFINATFIECKPIKQNFNCEGFVKKNIRKVFYDFYFKNKNKERNHTKIKRKYFNIMNDAFNGFNENDYTDFSK